MVAMLRGCGFGMETLHVEVDFVSESAGIGGKAIWASRSAPNMYVRTLGVKDMESERGRDVDEKGRLQSRHVQGQGEGFPESGQVGAAA